MVISDPVPMKPASLTRGMKIFAPSYTELGIGEVFSVQEEPVHFYKVLFQDPPIKVLYPNEVQHFIIPKGTLVQTRYGAGKVTKHLETQSDNGLEKYEIEFFRDKSRKILVEPAITRVNRGIPDDVNPDDFSVVDGRIIGYFLSAYYFRYCLPSDPRFQTICHGRIEAFPHQIKVINQVLDTYPARFLLCDEVGLGKTIEACAVLKEMLLQNIVHRAIIIVPANLVPQWKFELESKFNLDFMVYDGSKVKTLKKDYPETNPWTIHSRIITSLHFVRRDEHRKDLKDVFFDIAIIDEAHHLRRYHRPSGSHKKTKNYDLGEIISNNSRFLLLLTATPMQLNPFELFSLVKLVDPALFPRYSHFLEFKEKIAHYNLMIRNLKKYRKLNVFERNYMESMISDLMSNQNSLLEMDIHAQLSSGDPGLQNEIIEKIRDKHLLSNILIRNKKKHVLRGYLPKRKTKIVLIQPTQEELEVYKAIRLYITTVYQRSLEEKNSATGFVMVVFQRLLCSSHFALRKTIKKRVGKLREVQINLMQKRVELEKNALEMTEKEFQKKMDLVEKKISNVDQDVPLLNDYYDKLINLKIDSKAAALVDLITDLKKREEPGLKVIVFTQFIRTLQYLKTILENNIENVEVGVFHGRLDKAQKDIEVERFRSKKDGKPYVFISTEAGGEGRNFQFCHIVVNYDLPWNPMKLEQRIGRVDRLGQEHDVLIYNFALKDTVEEHIVSILSERIFSFQQMVGELEPILMDFKDDVENVLLMSRENDVDVSFEILGGKLADKLKFVRENSANMQDIIMEMESSNILEDETLSCNLELNYYHSLKNFVLLMSNTLHHSDTPPLKELHRQLLSSSYIKPDSKYEDFKLAHVRNGIYEIDENFNGMDHLGTFNRVDALKNERLEFFNLGHPVIENLIENALHIDATSHVGYFEDNFENILDFIPQASEIKVKKVQEFILICNLIRMTGVKSQRKIDCELFYSDTGDEGKRVRHGCQIPAEALIEYMLDTSRKQVEKEFSGKRLFCDGEFWCSNFLRDLIRFNKIKVEENIQGMKDDWKSVNKDAYERIKEKEEHYYNYKLKKYKDEALQYKFLINEKLAQSSKTDEEKITALEAKMQRIQEKIKEEQDDFQGILNEINANFENMDISFNMLGIIIIDLT